MKRYYFKVDWSECVTKHARRRGYNKLISVYIMRKDGQFRFIGSEWVQTAGYRGDYPTACGILSKEFGYKSDGYSLKRKDVTVLQLP